MPGITSTVLTRELLLQKNKSRVFSVVSVILVGWDTSCWRNLSAVMLISWLHRPGLEADPLTLLSVQLMSARLGLAYHMGSKPIQSSKNSSTVLTFWYDPLRGGSCLTASTPWLKFGETDVCRVAEVPRFSHVHANQLCYIGLTYNY